VQLKVKKLSDFSNG